MRRAGTMPLDPEIAAELDAVERALAGRPVDPKHAELAELALLVVGERPVLGAERAAALDERMAAVRARRTTRRGSAGPRALIAAPARRRPRAARGLAWGGGGAAVAVALVVALVLAAGSGGGRSAPSSVSATSASALSSATPRPPAAGARRGAYSPAHATAGEAKAPASAAGSPRASTPRALSSAGSTAQLQGAVVPQSSGRQVIESGQLQLSTAPKRIDQVAEEAFRVIGQVGGIVMRSTVNAGASGGYAEIQLRVPEQNLPQAMSELSTLPYATVAARTDQSQDVTGSYDADQRALADARALRTSLLKQLANALTLAQIDSLTARIHDAEASISSDRATLASLERQVGYSSVQLTINAGSAPGPVGSGSGGGFTIGRAAHDAGRVLTVAGGVALIALAVLVPLGLLVAVIVWIWLWLRRRGREHALDAA
jgi:hypothetical protein